MNELKLIFFALGTLAFFANVFLAIQHPDLVERPIGEEQMVSDHPLRKWDHLISWVMWSSWGVAGLLTFLDRAGYKDLLDF